MAKFENLTTDELRELHIGLESSHALRVDHDKYVNLKLYTDITKELEKNRKLK